MTANTLKTVLASLLAISLIVPVVPAEARSKSKGSSYSFGQKKKSTYGSGYTQRSHRGSKSEDCDLGDMLEGDEDCEGLLPGRQSN